MKRHVAITMIIVIEQTQLLLPIGIVIGIILVVIFDFGAKLQGYDFGLQVTLDSLIVAFIAAVVFGILFGLYPAKKASDLKIVDALRFE